MREKITKRTVEAVASGRRDVFLWDNELRGFGCKVTPTGSRIYVLQYSLNNRDHRVTIGRHGVDVTAEQARQEAWRLRGIVAASENPTYNPARDRAAALTVADLGDRYKSNTQCRTRNRLVLPKIAEILRTILFP